jgi:hypothetical protein
MSIKGLSRRSLILATPALLLPSRLSALSAAQGCRVIPPQAYDAGFRKLVFFDDFNTIKTIDVNGTGAPGYNWYTRQVFGSQYTQAITPTPASWLSLNNSILTLKTNNPAIGGFELQSIGYAGGGTYVKGFTLAPGNGAYLEVSAAFNPALSYGAVDARPWPIPLWIQDLAGTIALLNGTSQAHYIEYDLYECIPSGAGTCANNMNAHDWTAVGATNTQNTVVSNPVFAPGTGFNTYGLLWKTIAGGGGLVQRYFNGIHWAIIDVTYSAGAGSVPAASPSNPNGVFSSGDSETFVLFMAAGVNWPMQVDYVAVWQ